MHTPTHFHTNLRTLCIFHSDKEEGWVSDIADNGSYRPKPKDYVVAGKVQIQELINSPPTPTPMYVVNSPPTPTPVYVVFC